jgi:hypothetical protein
MRESEKNQSKAAVSSYRMLQQHLGKVAAAEEQIK